jgi:hypothetical protein
VPYKKRPQHGAGVWPLFFAERYAGITALAALLCAAMRPERYATADLRANNFCTMSQKLFDLLDKLREAYAANRNTSRCDEEVGAGAEAPLLGRAACFCKRQATSNQA